MATIGSSAGASSCISARASGQSDSGGRKEPRSWCWLRTSGVRSSASGRAWMPVTTTMPLRRNSGSASWMVSGTPVTSKPAVVRSSSMVRCEELPAPTEP